MTAVAEDYDDPRGGFRWRDRREWRDYAACRSAPLDLFFLDAENSDDGVSEPPYPTEEQLAYCSRCPVQEDCEREGRGEEYGVWAGTTAYQRQALNRPMSRVRCPVCTVVAVVTERGHELCLACGHSWRVYAGA